MIDIIKLTIMLTVISVAAALLIAFTNLKTFDKIEEQKNVAQLNALKEVVPSSMNIEEQTSDNDLLPKQYWVASNGSDTVFVFKIVSRGYSGNITYFVGTNKSGVIEGMSILEQSETPGLGSRMQETISNKYFWNGLFAKKEIDGPWFSRQFKGVDLNKPIKIEKSMGEWHKLTDDGKSALVSGNAVTAITGATISTRAVVDGIQDQVRKYLQAINGGSND